MTAAVSGGPLAPFTLIDYLLPTTQLAGEPAGWPASGFVIAVSPRM